jgi:type IV pilus assembly protein PilE
MSAKKLSLKERGFTLVELMIVVLLMAIILGISVPGYRAYVLRAGRADAGQALLRIAAAQERFYLQNGTYAGDADLAVDPPNGLGVTDSKSERGYYDLAIAPDAAGLAVGYSVTATVDATGNQKGDGECGSFSIDQNGRRGANGGHVAAVVEKCWR